MVNINVIIAEADLLVPNDVPVVNKVVALNSLNHDFFNVVKIPQMTYFVATKNEPKYILLSEIRLKNIKLVHVGVVKYHELNAETPNPLQNTFAFDDRFQTLALYPAPYQDGLTGSVRYDRIATTTFVSSNLNVSPDIPEEYQWTLIPALAAYIANTQDDGIKASNYENQYKSAWNVAAQNYAKEVTA